MQSVFKLAIGTMTAMGLMLATPVTAQETPKRGGVLSFVVGSKIPSYDLHRETTFGVIHPIRPFYSTIIRVNPDNPSDPADFVCDLCVGEVPAPTANGTVYTFNLKQGVLFHDGTEMTSADVKASMDKVIFPPEGVPSSRKAFFRMVEAVEAPDSTTIRFRLKFASGAFIPALATPFNVIYSKRDLDVHGYNWHAKNINGTGAFEFVQHQPGAFVEARRFENFHRTGYPFLDGYKSIEAPKMAVRLQAIRGDRAAIEFRGFPPKARDDLVSALGQRVEVQESDWNCVLLFTPNQKQKRFQDPRVRRALSLAVDRWGGSKYLSRIAIVKTVGGVVYPRHPFAASKAELTSLTGYAEDLRGARAQARKLLKAAGQSDLSFVLTNRAVDQPYKVVGTWLIDQWKKVGISVKQRVLPSGPFYDSLRKKRDFDVSIDFNCQSVVNPISDITKFLGSAGNNYGSYKDQQLEDLHAQLLREPEVPKQRSIIRAFEKRALDEMAHLGITLWWYKINPHRTYVKGWKIAPSHYLNQHLEQVWLDR
jgi:peptide/nickel transport system substrate-binding protein